MISKIIILLSILPLFYKFSFWTYVIQLKEYRWDRFKEYLSTKQWKSALINIWTVIELPLFILAFFVFFDRPFEIIIWNVLFIFLIIQNIFVFRKIIKRNLLKPKFTSRLSLTLLFLVLAIGLDLVYIISNNINLIIYNYIIWLLLFSPLIIFFSIILTLPIVNYLKKRKINKAVNIGKKIDKPIKIWITWSYWKSSVKEYLSSILEQDWKTLKTPENINTELWVSDLIIKKLNNNYKYFVAEMWAYKIWEILTLWNIVNHKYWFLTAIWNQHIALFWNKENIKKGKSEIAGSVLKNKWTLYINWENKDIRELKFDKKLNIVKYWNFKWSDSSYELIEWGENKTKFKFIYKDIKQNFEVNLIWNHNILNLTWVLSLCYDLWIKTDDLKKYLKNIKTPKSTLNIIKKENITFIDDTYNLSEDWLISWIESLKWFKQEKILVVDDILELWKKSEDIHYKLWKKIAKNYDFKNIVYVWINYKESFIKWLLDWWFKRKNIINNIPKTKKETVVLLEWRKARQYL